MAARSNTSNTSGNEAKNASDDTDHHHRPYEINNSLKLQKVGLIKSLFLSTLTQGWYE